MQVYRDDDLSLLRWMNANNNAFVLSVFTATPKSAALHTSRCPRIYPPIEAQIYPWNEKWCSTRMEELLEWANVDNVRVWECSTCKPYSMA